MWNLWSYRNNINATNSLADTYHILKLIEHNSLEKGQGNSHNQVLKKIEESLKSSALGEAVRLLLENEH